MASPSPSPSPSQSPSPPWPHHKRAIEELVRGRESAYALQLALNRSLADPNSSLSVHQQHHHQDLVSKILASFSDTLSILHYSSSPYSDEFSRLFPPPYVDSQYSSDARKSEDSSDSCKPLTATSKDRRGCYKRRRISETWSKESSTLVDDGHAWRKYGQKVILNAKHPRNYFRCTHKFEQGCQATKQVQMIQENPPIFRATYLGRHTCKNLLKPPQIVLDNDTTAATDSSFFLSFDQSIKNNNNNDSRRNNIYDSFMAAHHVFPLTKHEDTKEDIQDLLNVSSSSCDYDFLSPTALTGPLSSAGSDHGDVMSSGVYSCTASTRDSFGGMDLAVGSVDDFDDVLQFEF